MSNLIGHSLGRYQILEPLGEGGMAIVYKAYDTRLESEVAVKVIRIERLAPEILQRAMKRFEREAKSLAQLTHPNLVKVLDYGEYEGQPYLVMPYLPGGTLKQKMNGQPMPWQEAARLLIPIARALDYAHKRNLIHRDVKPSNILITESGEPMLTDFGVAKIIDEEATLDLTGTSAAVGTPEYMAPEQATSKNVDHRADIYALGIVFYEMVTGRRPFQADTPLAVLFKQASEPLPRPSQFVRDLPQHLEQLLIKALAKSPDDRFQSMGELASALEGVLDNTKTVKSIVSKPSRDETVNLVEKIPALKEASTKKPARKFNRRRIGIIAIILIIPLVGIFGINYAINNWSVIVLPTSTTRLSTKIATNTMQLPTSPSTHLPPTVTKTSIPLTSTLQVTDTPTRTSTAPPIVEATLYNSHNSIKVGWREYFQAHLSVNGVDVCDKDIHLCTWVWNYQGMQGNSFSYAFKKRGTYVITVTICYMTYCDTASTVIKVY